MWNEYFSKTRSKDNPQLHTFYREFFDKPPGRRVMRAIQPRRATLLDPPNLHSSLDRTSHRMPRQSKAVGRVGKLREVQWNHRFGVTYSKGNWEFYPTNREYFDSPRKNEGEDLASRVSTMGDWKRRTSGSRSKGQTRHSLSPY